METKKKEKKPSQDSPAPLQVPSEIEGDKGRWMADGNIAFIYSLRSWEHVALEGFFCGGGGASIWKNKKSPPPS